MSNLPQDTQLDLGYDEARRKVDQVKLHIARAWSEIIDLYRGRAWIALGHESWDALCTAEFDGARIRLPREERREVVGSLREAGLSTRAIASATGMSEATVRRDHAGASNDASARTTGIDGKRYAQVRAEPPSSTRSPAATPLFATPVPPPGEQAASPPTEARPIADPALQQWVETDQRVQDTGYMRAFLDTMVAAGRLGSFDGERIGRLADDLQTVSIRHMAEAMDQFMKGFDRGRRHLRVIDGGAE